MQFKTPNDVLTTLSNAFYKERNIDVILSCVTDNIEWIGTESHETAKGKANLKSMLTADFAALPHAIHVEMYKPDVQKIGDNVAILTLLGKKLSTPESSLNFAFRGTICCVKDDNGWLISSVHMSAPNVEIERASLQNTLMTERAKQKALLDNVPGGIAIYRIKKDGRIATDYVSDGLAKTCGYESGEDVLKVLGQDATKQIFPDDYKSVMDAVKTSVENKTPTSIQYRAYGKNGKIVRLTLDSVLTQDVALEDDDLAVFYAVQTRISDEKQKQIQKDEVRAKLMNYVPGGIGIYDIHDHIATLQYLNDAYLNMMELSHADRAQYYGNDISAVVYPDDRHIIADMIEDIYNGQRVTNILFRVLNGSKKWKWINLVMRVVKESNGHYTGYANLTDFDDIIKSQQEMEAAHKKEETLLSSIPGGIAVYRFKKSGKVTTEYVSEALAKMCGYTAEEFLAYLKDDALINLVPDDIPLVNTAVEKSLANHSNLSVTYRIYQKDKTPIMIRLDANAIESEVLADDDLAVYYAVHTLVSEEAQHIIEEQKALSLLLNSVPAGIGIYSVENGVLCQEYMNDAFFEILHSTRQEREQYAQNNVMTAIHPDDLPKVQKGIASVVQGANTFRVDYRLINGLGGYTWFHVAASVTERKEGFVRFFIAFSDCTESKEQELRLLQNERAVELAQIRGDLSIWTYNIDKGVIFQQIRAADKSSMGYKIRIENVPHCFIDDNAVYPDDIEKFLEAYKELASGKENVDITYRLRDQRTGEFTWVRMFYQCMENSSNNDRMAVGFSMNVNKEQEALERYRIEQALREQINDNVLMYVEYNLTNENFETDTKLTDTYSKSDWEGAQEKSYLSALTKTVEKSFIDDVAKVMYSKNLISAFEAGETKVSVEFRGKDKPDAPLAWYRADASLVKRPDTGDIMAFVTIEDIEKEKDRQLAIESSLSDGVESVAMIQLANIKTRLILENGVRTPSGHEMSFIYNDDFVKRSSMAVSEEDREFSYQAALLSTVIKELKTQDIYQYAVTTVFKGNTKKRKLFRFRYLDDRKADIVMSVSDVTSVYIEDQKNKRKLEAALDKAQQASRAKAEFYSRMSHDMRTPMNGILGMAELSKDENSTATLKENIGKIKESGEYLLSLINDTLDIQRIESGKMKLEPTIVSTNDIVSNIVDMISVTAKAKGVTLKFSKGNTDINWYVRADALRLKQIFINLLSNAIKFTPKGGTVEFEFKLLSRDGMISHDVVYVRDTGVGMSKEFLENGIFKPFSQESNAVSATYAGSGLGLSIAKSLVELMGGKIEVESELGAGTTFAVYLDFERVSDEEAKAALQNEKIQAKDITAQLNGTKILLAEDHPLNAEIAKKLLQKVGCETTWAQNGKEAVDMFNSVPAGTFDAILMDIRMPIMDGLEAAKHIRALDKPDAKTVPIIAMTANAYDDDRKASIEAGMNAHLGKPIEPKEMYDTLAMYLAK